MREFEVPNEAGLHRINWDLRHPVGDLSALEVWEPFEDPGLARSVAPRGHFVSPGSYTAILAARGTTVSTTFEVRGDPEMPLTQAQYEEREAFLSDVQRLLAAFREALDPSQGFGPGERGTMAVPTEALQTLMQHRRTVSSVYQALNGGGVRQGSLYPPTPAQRDRVEAAREALGAHGR